MSTTAHDDRVKKLEAELEAANQRETALNARTVELGSFQQQAATLADQNAELRRQLEDLTGRNEALERDAKAARAAAKSTADSAGADIAKLEAAQKLADAIRTLTS